jgi:hypothetical protein
MDCKSKLKSFAQDYNSNNIFFSLEKGIKDTECNQYFDPTVIKLPHHRCQHYAITNLFHLDMWTFQN